jgi:two-component sensor histidine kinase
MPLSSPVPTSLAPSYPQEAARLQALHRYQVLDTEHEKDFDELTELAAQICGTPVAIVTLIAEERQWFKASVGAGDVRETPRAISFCAHTILEPKLMVVPDMELDPRFVENPLVTSAPFIRFYAGAPLLTPEGLPLGTLCVLDTEPRHLSEHQLKTLEVLSRQVMAQMELRRQLRTVHELNVNLQRTRDESHHRIKNNLQVLAALVDLQRLKYHTATVPIAELERISIHIRSLGILHDLLTTHGPALETVVLHQSLEKLIPLLQAAAGRSDISLTVDPSLTLSARRASILLPLISELVGNAIKHGTGQITVGLRALPDSKLELEVCDEGVGFPQGFTASQAANTGLDLIESMVRWDLQGETYYENRPDGGACVRVVFVADTNPLI